MTDIVTSSPPDHPANPWRRWRRIFLGPHGLRAGWSLLIFLIVCELPSGLAGLALQRAGALPEHPAWDPGLLFGFEAASFAFVLVGIALMGWIEGRTFAAYGFPFREAFGRKFLTGSLWGILSIAAVVGMMALAGGYSVSGLAIHGGEAVKAAILWALATLAIGLYEENYFRGYTLFTLSRGMGFWRGAVLLSLVFGALHYFLKPRETWMDLLSVTLIGLFFCLTVRRTGSIWWAIGWHFTYNFGSLFVFGGPNTGNNGNPVPGHLLASTFHGPDWLTGGPMGPEASVFIFPVIALLFWAFLRRHPEVRFPAE
jgi:membrane protease YdiL (CAAX protease family)